MGEMAAGFAHELNQPLAAISNFAAGCIRRLKLPSPDIESIVAALEEVTGSQRGAEEHVRAVGARQGPRDTERCRWGRWH